MTSHRIPLAAQMQDYQHRVEAYLHHILPPPTTIPEQLHQAMHYAVFSGGKRIRSILVYLSGSLFTSDPAVLDAPAAAIECIHCYSLIHDDLPAMDNDDFRRGKPTVHKVYGEAIALLAGNALQSLAFEMLNFSPPGIAILAQAAGSQGLLGGQALDLHSKTNVLTMEDRAYMHSLKTASLFQASTHLGALLGGCQEEEATLTLLKQFGQLLGLAYQAQDDFLDKEKDAYTQTAVNALFDNASMILNKIGSRAERLQSFCDWLKDAPLQRSHTPV
jgi:geranylgeranyl pyrophosphate synthase